MDYYELIVLILELDSYIV